MPEIILEGRLFKSVPPLYLMTKSNKPYYKNKEWLFDKREYYSLYHKVIADNVSILLHYDNDEAVELTKEKKLLWLSVNKNYTIELNNLVKKTAGNAYILEHVCHYLQVCGDDRVKFKEMIEKEFPELTYDMSEQSLYGSFNGTYHALILDRIFMKISERIRSILSQNPTFYVGYKNKNNKESDYVKATVGTFLYAMENKYSIDIDQRFKGVGEVPNDLAFTAILNPNIRKLKKLTMENIPEVLGIIQMLHGKDKDNSEQRRALLRNADITYDDIDN
jgi:DNA gyrase/topoisomerase IV subunit B